MSRIKVLHLPGLHAGGEVSAAEAARRAGAAVVVLLALLCGTLASTAAAQQDTTTGSDSAEVRIVARRLESGRIEFGLQQRRSDDSWGDRRLPRVRFFPSTARTDRWLASSTLTLIALRTGVTGGTGTAGAPRVLPAGACEGSSEDDAVVWVESNGAKDVSWSPGCTRVAFIHHGDLWLMTSGGRAHRLVVDDDHASLLTTAWSPDGARIAYGRQHEQGGVWVSHIWTVSPDGGGARQLTHGDTFDMWPAWSPDSSRIAFSRLVGNDRFIVVMDSDGSRQRSLTAGGSWEQTPAWSPDGARLAYIAGDKVIVANADGSGARAAFGGVAQIGGLSWSPEGNRVAFVRDRGTRSALHVSSPDGTGERMIAESDGDVRIPKWSPDGQRVAFHIASDTASRLYVTGIDSTGFIEANPTRKIPPAGRAPVGEPPEELGLDPFYAKHVDGALPVVGSSEVSDEALRRAALVLGQMTANRPDIIRALALHRVRVAVYAVTEEIKDLPEVAETYPDLGPSAYALAPTGGFPLVALPEANLLCHPREYSSVTVHEGGHAIQYALRLLGDGTFQSRLDAAYENAIARGLWEGTYGATNADEYWAEGVMWFMNAADERDFTYTWVNTRDELQDYDPVLYELVRSVLGDVEATASCYGK